MHNVIVTGANGFVGRYVVRHIAQRWPQATVWATARHAASEAHPQVHWTALDMLDAAGLDTLVKRTQPDAIVHLAAASSVGYSWAEPRDSTLNNLNIYLNLLEATRRHAPRARILSVGSSEVYGQLTAHDVPLREDRSVQPASPYGVARAAQEQLSQVYAAGYGLDIVSTRSFNHFGPGQDARFALPSFARQIAAAKQSGAAHCTLRTGNVEVVRDFTDVRDVAAAYVLLLEKGEAGQIYNVCSGTGRSLRDVIGAMAAMAGINVEIAIQDELVRPTDLPVITGDNGKIRARIGWAPQIPFAQTVQDVMTEWLEK